MSGMSFKIIFFPGILTFCQSSTHYKINRIQAIEDSLKIWANYSRFNEDLYGSAFFVRLIVVFVMHDSTNRILLYLA